AGRAPLDVQLAGAVAALAADGVPLEHRLPVAVCRVLHRLRLVAVAEQAARPNGPAKVQVPRRVAWGQVPAAGLRIPRDRRLEKVSIMIDEVGTSTTARAEDELDLGFGLGQHLALRVGGPLAVEHAVFLAPDAVVQAGADKWVGDRKRVGRRRPVPFARR